MTERERDMVRRSAENVLFGTEVTIVSSVAGGAMTVTVRGDILAGVISGACRCGDAARTLDTVHLVCHILLELARQNTDGVSVTATGAAARALASCDDRNSDEEGGGE